MPQDYNKTLNLPATQFPMRASLPAREPETLAKWEEERLYYKLLALREGRPLYVFHDGPPYANASIHLGTAMNKVLKDVIVRNKNMSGYLCHYVPGWDTHGLPIELKAMKEMGLEEAADPVRRRRHCRDFALTHIETQKKQFKRLGTVADYENPYLTLQPAYEALQIEIFGDMAEKGYIYKDLKSVLWCPQCETALAEAEIEYADDPCDSIYVKFPVKSDPNGVLARMGVDDISAASFLIWTTTTWTIPANLAICLGPKFEYAAVRAKGEVYILAKELTEATMAAGGISEYEIMGSVLGRELEYVVCAHPYLERDSLVILGEHVTLESGTGAVHTAPGHGTEDFDVVARHYPQLGIVVPVDSKGRMTAEAGEFVAGVPTGKANKLILERLREDGTLFAVAHIQHQYPHCWRCREPILFRATEQWFCNVDDFKEETIAAIDTVTFLPAWGKGRIAGMVEGRSAWCLSRQRAWGMPIPAFYCGVCGKPIMNKKTSAAVSALFGREGSDSWWLRPAHEILPEGFVCPECGNADMQNWTKETDTMDVWFDSGISHAAVLRGNWPNQAWPCDLYLEGTDQYRGWFQSALLTAVAWQGVAPYKTVVTHGWTVDGEGRKMSKSLGNGIEPEEIIKEYGADILRLWVVSTDYHADMRISKDILKQLSEIYRKLRNTARYILGNLSDFDPETDCVADEDLLDLDRWALFELDGLLLRCRAVYESFEFHILFHAIHNFCTVDMSNFYLDVLKDRLYCELAVGHLRRSAQTTIYRILRALTLLLTPIIPFTSEEIWGYLPSDKDYNADAAQFNDIPERIELNITRSFFDKWKCLRKIREVVLGALEAARVEKQIGKSLEAKIVLNAPIEQYTILRENEAELADLFIVSQVEISETASDELSVKVLPANGEKCERCWKHDVSVGQNAAHPTLCARCAGVITEMGL